MITARHSGKVGDCCYAIPAMKMLGIQVLYLPEQTGECSNLYSSLKRLMGLQGFEVGRYTDNLPYGVLDPAMPVDYDLDQARNQPLKGLTHIVKRYLDTYRLNLPNWKEPWLIVDDVQPIKGEYVVINFTNRHVLNEQTGVRSQVDWKKVYHSIPEKKYFVGTKEEHKYFCEMFVPIDYFETGDMLDVARVVKGAKAVYCNQSAVLAISQGLGKEVHLARKPGKTNCLLYTPNEFELL